MGTLAEAKEETMDITPVLPDGRKITDPSLSSADFEAAIRFYEKHGAAGCGMHLMVKECLKQRTIGLSKMREPAVRYCLKHIKCKECGNSVYANEEEARSAIDKILPNVTGNKLTISKLCDELPYIERCDRCEDMLERV